MNTIQDLKSCFIDGTFQNGQAPNTLTVTDKYTSETLATLQYADEKQLKLALSSASQAFQSFKKTSAGDRSNALLKLASLIQNDKATIAQIIIQEAGKPRSYAEAEVDRSVATIEAAAHEALRFTGEMINIDHHNGIGRQAMTKRFAKGVVAAISPFNFPLNLALHKIAPAIAVGCPVLLKPSPFTPLTALYLAALVAKLDLPKGTLQVINCDNSLAQELVSADEVAMISFTGSDKIGWHIKQSVPKKPVALELGGNAALIIDENADIKAIAQKLIPGAFLYAGQICISTQRVYVHESQYEDLIDEVRSALENLHVGNPDDVNVLCGPVIDKKAFDRIAAMVTEACDNGAEIIAQSASRDDQRHIYPPTVLTCTKPNDRVIQEEIFGPVVSIEPFKSFKDAIELVNNSRYGLQAGVYTSSIEHMKLAFDQLEVGGVIMNDIPGFRVDAMPYGGVKDSGTGREGPYYTMLEMTEPRLLVY